MPWVFYSSKMMKIECFTNPMKELFSYRKIIGLFFKCEPFFKPEPVSLPNRIPLNVQIKAQLKISRIRNESNLQNTKNTTKFVPNSIGFEFLKFLIEPFFKNLI